MKKMAKRTVKVLPVIFLSMAGMLILFLGCLKAFQLNGRIKVGVSIAREDEVMASLIGYVENMNHLSSLCDFEKMGEEEGREKLEQGEISALLVIPKGILTQIYRNEEAAIRVYLPETPTMDSGLIKEFSQSGASLVLSAKAGDFTAYELYRKYGVAGSIERVSLDMNREYISFVLLQERIFDNQAIVGEDGMSDGNRLMTAGLTCLLVLLGIPAVGLMQRVPPELSLQLKRQGVGSLYQLTVSMGMMMGCLYVVGAAACISACLYLGETGGILFSLLAMLPICFMLTAFFHFLYSMGKGRAGAVLMVFFSAIIFVFLPGGIFPPYMLPQGMVSLGRVLPGGVMMQEFFYSIWKGRFDILSLGIIGYGGLFLILAGVFKRRGGKRV
ncbi:MAG: ABC transporter permease [Lachnospiraceae bacterium]|nr:ABC transporter permease [Lachnospiraceae bacterium]